MVLFIGLLLHVLAAPFKSQARLEAEIVFLCHQLNLLRRRRPARPRLTPWDRLLLILLYRLVPSLLNSAVVIQPGTIGTEQVSGLIGGGSRARALAGPRSRLRCGA